MILLPPPRRLELTEGAFALPRRAHIQLLSAPAELPPPARVIQKALEDRTSLHYPIAAAGPSDQVAIDLLLSSQMPHSQGYEIEIEPHGIHMTAASPEGTFYAAQTFAQILRQHGDSPLPCLQIEDRPDFRARGVMLDVSPDKVPTMVTLFALIDQFR